MLNILEAYRYHCSNAKFYQASSSEMFGRTVDDDGFQRETTKMEPTSPYGCAKVFGYNIVRHYRFAVTIYLRVMVFYLITNHQDEVLTL